VQTEGFTGLLFDIRAELLTEDVGSLKDRWFSVDGSRGWYLSKDARNGATIRTMYQIPLQLHVELCFSGSSDGRTYVNVGRHWNGLRFHHLLFFWGHLLSFTASHLIQWHLKVVLDWMEFFSIDYLRFVSLSQNNRHFRIRESFRRLICVSVLVVRLEFHPQLLFWATRVSLGASHLYQWPLKMVLDWNESIHLHFVRVDWNRFWSHPLLLFWAKRVSFTVSHSIQWCLKVVLDWGASIALHLDAVDWNRLRFHPRFLFREKRFFHRAS
jgi:hypothetical protein